MTSAIRTGRVLGAALIVAALVANITGHVQAGDFSFFDTLGYFSQQSNILAVIAARRRGPLHRQAPPPVARVRPRDRRDLPRHRHRRVLDPARRLRGRRPVPLVHPDDARPLLRHPARRLACSRAPASRSPSRAPGSSSPTRWCGSPSPSSAARPTAGSPTPSWTPRTGTCPSRSSWAASSSWAWRSGRGSSASTRWRVVTPV